MRTETTRRVVSCGAGGLTPLGVRIPDPVFCPGWLTPGEKNRKEYGSNGNPPVWVNDVRRWPCLRRPGMSYVVPSD